MQCPITSHEICHVGSQVTQWSRTKEFPSVKLDFYIFRMSHSLNLRSRMADFALCGRAVQRARGGNTDKRELISKWLTG